MSVTVNIEQRENFLHATVTGPNSPESVLAYMARIQAACQANDCYRVLIEERLDGPRFDEMQIFSLIQEGSPDALGFFDALAYVDEQQDYERTKFAETVAVNRGIPVAVFSTVDAAEDWIRTRSESASGQDIFRGIPDV